MRVFFKVLLLGVVLLHGDNAMAYEEPSYEVVQKFDAFELRQYEPYVVAETYVYGEFSDVGSSAFRRLFGYISEEKRPQGKIAMTTPVIQQPALPDTAANDEEDDGRTVSNRYRFAFVMPADYSLESLPVPDDAEVSLAEVPARLIAARRYSGTWSEERYRKNELILLEAVAKEGYQVVGSPMFARYNAPFSLWFLRRNEVLIEVKIID